MKTDLLKPNEERLKNRLVEVLLNTTTSGKSVDVKDLRKIARAFPGGDKFLDKFLDHAVDSGALLKNKGMSDGESSTLYCANNKFLELIGNALSTAPRSFSIAEKSLIKKVHGFMSAQQLLDLLNDRLVSGHGENAILYTMDQLYSEIGESGPSGALDWPAMRKLIDKAERDGVLNLINEQLIEDFAVVYSLNSKQVLVLKEIILDAKEGF